MLVTAANVQPTAVLMAAVALELGVPVWAKTPVARRDTPVAIRIKCLTFGSPIVKTKVLVRAYSSYKAPPPRHTANVVADGPKGKHSGKT
jgi:hypothetical protein